MAKNRRARLDENDKVVWEDDDTDYIEVSNASWNPGYLRYIFYPMSRGVRSK